MEILYAKCILYAYPHLLALAEQIDELVEKKALASMTDYTPCLFQCENIIDLTNQKARIFQLYNFVNELLAKLTEEELCLLDYKYFKNALGKDVSNLDFTSRSYFRKQVKIAEKFADKFFTNYINCKSFEQKYLSMDFFKEMLNRVKDMDQISKKNKPMIEKIALKNNKKNTYSSQNLQNSIAV